MIPEDREMMFEQQHHHQRQQQAMAEPMRYQHQHQFMRIEEKAAHRQLDEEEDLVMDELETLPSGSAAMATTFHQDVAQQNLKAYAKRRLSATGSTTELPPERHSNQTAMSSGSSSSNNNNSNNNTDSKTAPAATQQKEKRRHR
jgi:hypothetical protein